MALDEAGLRLLRQARRAVLATTGPDAQPRLVPVVFALDEEAEPALLYSPLDDKPKRVADPLKLARVKDILSRPSVVLLVDHWSEDWSELAWLRVAGQARLLLPADAPDEHARAVRLLRSRYAQYDGRPLESWPLLRVVIERTTAWQARQ